MVCVLDDFHDCLLGGAGMKTEITMTPEELDEIEKTEFKRGEDCGLISTINHLRFVMSMPTTKDTRLFEDKTQKNKYEEIRECLRKGAQ